MPKRRLKIGEGPNAKRYRGGYHQRQAAREVDSSSSHEDPPIERSCLADGLVGKYAWGDLSAPQAQSLAQMGANDGIPHVDLLAISQCGASGTQPQNCKRYLEDYFFDTKSLPKPYIARAPVINPKKSTRDIVFADVPFLLLQDWLHVFSTVWTDRYSVLLGLDRLDMCWANVSRRMPALRSHPLFSVPNYKDLFVPILVHGDGVDFKKGGSMTVYDFKPLLCSQPTKHSTMMIAAWPKDNTARPRWGHSECTWAYLHAVMKWDLECVYNNQFGARDHLGRRWPKGSKRATLAGQKISKQGHRLFVIALTGDQDFVLTTWVCPIIPKISSAGIALPITLMSSSGMTSQSLLCLSQCAIVWPNVEQTQPAHAHSFKYQDAISCRSSLMYYMPQIKVGYSLILLRIQFVP